VGALVDFFKDVFEAAIVPLWDGVFGAQVQRIIALDGILERGIYGNCIVSLIIQTGEFCFQG
jgi:hypothetical protein